MLGYPGMWIKAGSQGQHLAVVQILPADYARLANRKTSKILSPFLLLVPTYSKGNLSPLLDLNYHPGYHRMLAHAWIVAKRAERN